jgi:hypothetical protein
VISAYGNPFPVELPERRVAMTRVKLSLRITLQGKEQNEEEVAKIWDSPVSSASPELNWMVEADAVSSGEEGNGNEECRSIVRTIAGLLIAQG